MINIHYIDENTTSVTFLIIGFTGCIWDYNIGDRPLDISVTDINNVFNELLHHDDITIEFADRTFIFKKDDFNYRLTEAEIRGFKCRPFAHQIEAVNFGLKKDRSKWLLLDSMG